MALRIEAAGTIQLIEELSRRTGERAETVVEVALRERLARLRTPAEEADRRAKVYAHVVALQEAFSRHPEALVDHDELLYGEDGMPK